MPLPSVRTLRCADLRWQDTAVNTDPAPSSLSVAGRVMRREVRDWGHALAEHRPAEARSLVRVASQRYLRWQPGPL